MSLFHTNTLIGASGSGSSSLYVDDVFSTFLYDGTGGSRTITNGIDFSGEGGLAWIKERDDGSAWHYLFDTERGATKVVASNNNNQEFTTSSGLTSFTSSGFTLNTDGDVNGSGDKYVSWNFRKAPGFFDVVTYTGNGTAGRTVSHSLGSTPGMVAVKRLDSNIGWQVYHRSLGNTKAINLNESFGSGTSSNFNNTDPTSTNFTVGSGSAVNSNNATYVAYVFAHDDQSFGTDEDEAIIKCDSYTGSGSQGKYVEVGFEPQWLMIKRTAGSGAWKIVDMMRGMFAGHDAKYLQANEYDAEFSDDAIEPGPTGFTLKTTGSDLNSSSETYIYMAIRRPHKPPEAGTDVFAIDVNTQSEPEYVSNFVVDWAFHFNLNGDNFDSFARLTGPSRNELNKGDTQGTNSAAKFDFMDGWGDNLANSTNYRSWMFRRAPGFFDVVAYSGNSTDNRAISHNLTVKPELLITYGVNFGGGAGFTIVPDLDQDEMVKLVNDTAKVASFYGDDFSNQPTATHYKVSNNNDINETGRTYITYMFATLSGISKVGTFSGTGNNIDVDCGFAAGARFVLIKRFDSTGDWYLYDTVRGIVSGNDPYLLVNSTAAQVTNTDYIDPLNSGFTVTSSAPAALNTSGGTYIFLAIA